MSEDAETLKRELAEARAANAKLHRRCQALESAGAVDIAQMRERLTWHERTLATRNIELDALHYVWSTDGKDTGVHRFDGKGPGAITREVAEAAIRNTDRLVSWYRGAELRRVRRELDVPDVKATVDAIRKQAIDAASQRDQAYEAASRHAEGERKANLERDAAIRDRDRMQQKLIRAMSPAGSSTCRRA